MLHPDPRIVFRKTVAHHAIRMPSLRTTYRCPLNALSTCWRVFPTVAQCPAPILARSRRLVFRRCVKRHPRASRTLPPRHESPKLRDGVSPSAKRPLYVLASFSSCSTMPCTSPGPKTAYHLPQMRQTSPSGFQNPSTWPWLRDDVSPSAQRPLRVSRLQISDNIRCG